MIGSSLEELNDKLITGHEIEFQYNGKKYSIESSIENDNNTVSIWALSDASTYCIANAIISNVDDLKLLLNRNIFDGKTFLEVESEIIVDNIF